jgi:FdhD protein
MPLKYMQGILVKSDSVRTVDDPIVTEEKVNIYLNNEMLSSQVATPEDLEELGAGFVISEGISDIIESVRTYGNDIYVEAELKRKLSPVTCSSGGACSNTPFKHVKSGMKIKKADIPAVTEEIVSDLWRKTGAVHYSVLFSEGRKVAGFSDIGRHNTVDKVIGYTALNGIDTGRCYIGSTGRQPAGMVSKLANAGIPVMITKAATTTEGIRIASENGITLICFARGDRFTVYSHPERVEDLNIP